MAILTGVGGLILLLAAMAGAIVLDSPQLAQARTGGGLSWIVAVSLTTLLVAVSAVATYLRLLG